MARATVLVRRATPEDLPVLLDLLTEMRGLVASRLPARPSAEVNAASAQRLTDAMARADRCVLLAVDCMTADDIAVETPIGMALLELSDASALFDTPAVLVAFAHVLRSQRRRGAGHLFLSAAAQWAEENGVEAVAVNVAAQQRDAQRFYVRMGFAPVSMRRVAPLSVLKRRLGQEAIVPAVPTVGEAAHTASRRSQRARTITARAVMARRRAL